jgi:hypothetical protein
MKVLVIGGGPAGMLAGIKSSEEKNEVIILEKNNSLGKKLLITGKGRCNITSSLKISEFIANIPGNGKFLYSAFKNYNNEDIIKLLKQEGLDVKEERGNRIFPVTDNARDVLNALIKRIKKLNINIKVNSRVNKIIVSENKAIGVIYNNNEKIYADKIILATGGMSYPTTGSTGDGYKIAELLGHSIQKITPSLVPLEIYQKSICKQMQGLSLRNIKIKIYDIEKNKLIYEDFGEMMFTHFGISGPVIISSSAHLVRYKNIDNLLNNRKIKLYIDLKPALTVEKLNERILRDFSEQKNKQFRNSLDKLLPKKMIPIIIKLSKINPDKKVNEITREERNTLVDILKKFELDISNFRPIDEAIITAGGISIKEINPKTMESKIVKNLYFAGEIIDVDAYTGGFNLQIAYSTGYTAGKNSEI